MLSEYQTNSPKMFIFRNVIWHNMTGHHHHIISYHIRKSY